MSAAIYTATRLRDQKQVVIKCVRKDLYLQTGRDIKVNNISNSRKASIANTEFLENLIVPIYANIMESTKTRHRYTSSCKNWNLIFFNFCNSNYFNQPNN